MPKKKSRGNGTGTYFYDKSKGLWYARVRVGYKDGKPKYSKRSFKTKTEAINGLSRLSTDLEIGQVAEPTRVTVGQMLQDWLEWKAPRDLRPTTEASYGREIRLRLTPLLGPSRVQALTKTDIERAYEAMREPRDDHRNNGKKLVVSVETVRVAARVLKLALKEWGVGRGIITKNPAEHAKLPKVRARRGEAGGGRHKYEPYSDAELRKFLEATFEHRLFIAFFLAGALGLREGEVAGLRWNHLKIDPPQLSAEGAGEARIQVQRTREGGEIIEGPPKSERGTRPLHLSPKAVATLRAHRAQQQEWAQEYGWRWAGDGYVVVKPEDGSPLRPDSIWRRFRALTNRLGLRPVAFHDLRHGYVSIMAADGVPLEVISKLVGHHSPAFTAEAYRSIFRSEALVASTVMDKVSPEVGVRVLPKTPSSPAPNAEPEPTPVLVRHKLTPHQARRVKARIEAGERPEDVALDYGISGRMARYIAKGERYDWASETGNRRVL